MGGNAYRNNKFIVGIDTDKLLGLSFTGMNTRNNLMTVHLKTQGANSFLGNKPDDADLTAAVGTLNTSIATKQNKFIVADIPANTGRLFENNSTAFKAINVASPLSIKATRDDYLTISCDSYTKAESDTKISNLVGAAPVLLNTLVELSAALTMMRVMPRQSRMLWLLKLLSTDLLLRAQLVESRR
jgi:hypothetical protein